MKPQGARGERIAAAGHHQSELVPRHVTLLMFTASQERRGQGRRTKAHRWCVEDEDAVHGGPGRRERGKRCVTGHWVTCSRLHDVDAQRDDIRDTPAGRGENILQVVERLGHLRREILADQPLLRIPADLTGDMDEAPPGGGHCL
jgi:hypothetical protein